jgi:hypothetical protein
MALEEAGASGGGCPLEPQFTELYAVLGDRAAQDAIRLAHLSETHCPILRSNPNGCTGCANNPNEAPGKIEAAQSARELEPLLDRAYRQHLLAELGLLRPEDVSTADLEVLGPVHQQIVTHRLKAQAFFIGDQVAALFRNKT